MQVKGLAVLSSLEYLRTREGAKAQEYVDAAGGVSMAQLQLVQPQGWYDIEYFNTVLDAHVRCARARDEDLAKHFFEVGEYIAEDNLTTVYKVLLKFSSPSRLLGTLPRMWDQYFRGLTARAQAVDATHGVLEVRGLNEGRHISPTAKGWLHLAFRKVGAANVVIEERHYSPVNTSPDHLVFDIRW